MGRLKGLGLLAAVALAGCASAPKYAESDFTRTPISSYGTIGAKSFSDRTGKEFEVFGRCADRRSEFVIRETDRFVSGYDGRWFTGSNQSDPYSSSQSFYDRDKFLRALSSLEVVKPAQGLSGEQRMKVASSEDFKIPDLCEAMQDKEQAERSSRAKAEAEKNSAMIDEVTSRTGVRPMLTGRNEKDFNGLVMMLRSMGVESFSGKFFWAQDGDYLVSQILKGEVVLTSLTNPALFPPISIVTGKQALEGQPWSAVSRGPLQFIGPRMYQTALGVERQVLVFKQI